MALPLLFGSGLLDLALPLPFQVTSAHMPLRDARARGTELPMRGGLLISANVGEKHAGWCS